MSGEGDQPQAIRKLAPGRLVIASHNPGKVREIAELLEGHGLEVISAAALDLRACLDRAYDEGRFGGQVRYDAPADPPMRKLDAAWAADLLKARAAT